MVRRHEIGLEKIKGIRIGQAENTDAGTGCTVFLSDHGMAAGLDVRGGGCRTSDPWDRAGRRKRFRSQCC